MSIAANLQRLHNEIADACARAGRNSGDVALMAVSKTHPAEAILEAYAAGHRLFGENRVQEFATKASALGSMFEPALARSEPSTLDSGPSPSEPLALGPQPSFHLIGPLQNNKTTRAAELFHAIDTLDSHKTAERLNSSAATLGKTIPVLVEVKLSPEDTKHGLAPEDLPEFLASLQPLTNLTVQGLMTVPPWSEDPETARPYFQHLRRLRDDSIAHHPTLTELSMGMSNDFRVAIEEGSTTVRIGTAIFGKREYA